MPLDQETIDQQHKRLAAQRQRLALLFEQQAKLGAYTPPYVVIDMREAQAAIAAIKAALRAGGALVDDTPNDDAPLAAITSQAAPTLHRLRAPVGDFVGRAAEIEQLVQALSAAAGNGALAAISGMGGIGKTELAYSVAQRLEASFPDAQLLLELRGASPTPVSPEQALQTVIRVFEPEAKLPDDLAQLAGRYAAALHGKRVLILADDAKEAAQVRSLPPPPGCALLITSRNRFTLPAMRVLDLGTLPPQEAAQLLLAICPRIGEHAVELVKLCGALPLALRVSASLLETNDTRSVSAYLTQLAAERLKHLSDPDDPAASVEASLQLSYDALASDAQVALCQLSVFPVSFDLEAAKAVIKINTGAGLFPRLTRWLRRQDTKRLQNLDELLGDLRRRSLLEWDAALARYSLHDLARAFATARLEDAGKGQLRHARHYAKVADAAENFYLEGGAATLTGLALFDRERMHIDAGWGWAMAHAGGQDADALLLDFAATPHIGDLRYDWRRERIPQLESQLAAARRLKNKSAKGAALGNLGVVYRKLGEARTAITFYEQHLAVAREIGDRHGQGNALGNLGNAYMNLGEARTAITFHEQHLAIARAIGDQRGQENVLNNLGLDYADLGDIHKAIEFYEQALAIARAIGDQWGQGNVLNNLGSAYLTLGEARTAITFHEQRLEIARAIGDRSGQGSALGNLGNSYDTLGESRTAITFHEQHLAVARAIGDRRGQGSALGNLGNAYMHLGEMHTAIIFHEQHLAVARAIGDRHGQGNALGNLGRVYAALGDAHKAIDFYEQDLVVARAIGDRHGEAIVSWNLGLTLEKEGQFPQALAAMQVCVDFEREISHPNAEKDAAMLERVRGRMADERRTTNDE